ncbi:MAG: RibD family protein, partial [Betaproteobacteria bacterium]|nr:RibD family protein [Betaproteobacteria bacterium]
AGGGVLIAAAREDRDAMRMLQEKGAEVVLLPNEAGKVDLMRLMQMLASREVNEVHVEAGYRLNGSLLAEGLVDELVVYLAPHLLGDSARGMFSLPELQDLEGRRALKVSDVRMIEDDIRIIARVTNV